MRSSREPAYRGTSWLKFLLGVRGAAMTAMSGLVVVVMMVMMVAICGGMMLGGARTVLRRRHR
jgi:hypothetical protein